MTGMSMMTRCNHFNDKLEDISAMKSRDNETDRLLPSGFSKVSVCS